MKPEQTHEDERTDSADSEADWGLSAGSSGMSSNTAVGLVLILVLIAAFSFVVYKKMNAQQSDPGEVKFAGQDGTQPQDGQNGDDEDPFNSVSDPFTADGDGKRHDPRGLRPRGHDQHNQSPFASDDGGGRGSGDHHRQHVQAAGQSQPRQYAQGAFGSDVQGGATPFSDLDEPPKKASPPAAHQHSQEDAGFDFDEFVQSTDSPAHRDGHHGADGEDMFGAFDPPAGTAGARQQNPKQTADDLNAFDDAFEQNGGMWQDDDAAAPPPPKQQFADDDLFDDQESPFANEGAHDATDDEFGALDVAAQHPKQSASTWDEPLDDVDDRSFGNDAFANDPAEDTPGSQSAADEWDDLPDQFDGGFADEEPRPFQRPTRPPAGHHHDWPAGQDAFGHDGADVAGSDWPAGTEDPFTNGHPGSGQIPPDGSRHGVYVVEQSDNYWSISKKIYGTPRYYMALLKFNEKRIPDPTRMRPGMQVVTPTVEFLESHFRDILPNGARQVGASVVGAGSDNPQPVGFFQGHGGRPMYRVGSDDTLSGIAHRHLGRASRWIQIYALNRKTLPTPHDLPIGAELVLPRDASQVQLVETPHETR